MFHRLNKINTPPKPFEFYTADELWTNEHTSKKMLEFHLDEKNDLASRKHQFIERSAAWIIDKFGISKNTKVADFGCGPGLYANRIAKHCDNVTGIDFSKNSIDYAISVADKENLKADYIVENYLNLTTDKKFDLILMIWCDFCALSPAQRRKLLQLYYSLLNDDGSILLDVHSTVLFEKREESAGYEKNRMDGFWSPRDYYCFFNTWKYEDVKVTLDKYTIIQENSEKTVYNWLQYFTPETLSDEMTSHGFEVLELLGDVASSPYHTDNDDFAVIAKKKA